jgi:hypothetical protein
LRATTEDLVDGEIRIGMGRCLCVLAIFGLMFAGPATAWATLNGLKPPFGLFTIIAWCAGQGLVGVVSYVSGRQARERSRVTTVNPAVERAIRIR